MASTTHEEADEQGSGTNALITALGIAQICAWGTLYYSFALSRDAYRAINGALIAPMNVTLAIAPLAAAWILVEDGRLRRRYQSRR